MRIEYTTVTDKVLIVLTTAEARRLRNILVRPAYTAEEERLIEDMFITLGITIPEEVA